MFGRISNRKNAGNAIWNVLPLMWRFRRPNYFYGDHFAAKGRQKATF